MFNSKISTESANGVTRLHPDKFQKDMSRLVCAGRVSVSCKIYNYVSSAHLYTRCDILTSLSSSAALVVMGHWYKHWIPLNSSTNPYNDRQSLQDLLCTGELFVTDDIQFRRAVSSSHATACSLTGAVRAVLFVDQRKYMESDTFQR